MSSIRKSSVYKSLDWVLVALVIVLCVFGWLNIVSATSDIELDWMHLSGKAGKQIMWIGICTALAFIIVNIESEFFIRTSIIQYLATLLLLAAVLVVGKKIGGARSWFGFGGFSLQPSEFAKPTTALAIAWYLSRDTSKWKDIQARIISLIL